VGLNALTFLRRAFVIYTVTANPTLDKTLAVGQLRPGEFHRAQIVRQDLSGKGINVSLALKELGIPSKTLGFIGGRVGQAFQVGLSAMGLDLAFIDVGGETRQNLTVLDESNGVHTKINEPGPTVSEEHIQALYAQAETFTQPGDFWVLSGSLPPGAPSDFYAEIIRRVRNNAGKAFLDSSGEPLRLGVEAQPYCIKPNSEEASEFFGEPVETDAQHIQAVKRLLEPEHVQIAAVTRGKDGIALALKREPGRVLLARPPQVDAPTPIAAGDSTLTGIIWALLDGCDMETMARRAVAFGTATAMQPGSSIGSRALVESLIPQVTITMAG
jgi:1-phosphofructokinase family hexose kinase